MKIVITDIRFDLMKKTPMLVTITVFDQLGVEQLKLPNLPTSLFHGELAVGQRLYLAPNIDEIKVS